MLVEGDVQEEFGGPRARQNTSRGGLVGRAGGFLEAAWCLERDTPLSKKRGQSYDF